VGTLMDSARDIFMSHSQCGGRYKTKSTPNSSRSYETQHWSCTWGCGIFIRAKTSVIPFGMKRGKRRIKKKQLVFTEARENFPVGTRGEERPLRFSAQVGLSAGGDSERISLFFSSGFPYSPLPKKKKNKVLFFRQRGSDKRNFPLRKMVAAALR